jgi:SAM-dependent methyltransferase
MRPQSQQLATAANTLSHTLQKLNIGCGNQILTGWVNHDLCALPGVDVVHDLTVFPWPFDNNAFDEVLMTHVLEHLPETVKTMEELHRITRPGARTLIRVPYWNSPDMINDPTHQTAFNENTLNFFDPSTRQGKERPYYSTARFHIAEKAYYTNFRRYRQVSRPGAMRVLERLARHLGGIIWVVEFRLVTLKGA